MNKKQFITFIKKLIEIEEKEAKGKSEYTRGYEQGQLYTLKMILEELEKKE